MKKKEHTSILIFIFLAITFIFGVTYLIWRWIYTLNLFTSPWTSFWSYTLFAAEALTLIVFTNFGLILFKASRLKKTVPDNKLQQDYFKDVYKDGELLNFKNYCPSVAIFICTLNESPDMLSTTIAASNNIDYPNYKVYVLDDGKRDEIRELTELLGCNYITRTTNKGFKAGNINNALGQTESDIVVIFDADHIPASTFLKETVYNFSDEKVALVQTPQHFCNPDAFQKNLGLSNYLYNEQDIFYRVIEPGLNEFDSVFCGGTNILINRKHLNDVGNFPENTITEDSLLGLEFHSRQLKVVYYNRPIAIGLAASSFEEYIKQRCRWAKGNVQIVTNTANWKYYAKLNPVQLFFYLSGVLYFFTPLARLVFLIMPVLFLFFDITTVLILFYQILALQLCYFSLKFLFVFSTKVKFSNMVFADVYDLVTSIFTIGSILQALLIPKRFAKIKFQVTKKEMNKEKTNYKYKGTMITILSILILAEIQGFYDIFYSNPYSTLAIVANLFWNTINIAIMYFGVKVVSEQPEKRVYQRIKTNQELHLKDEQNHTYPTSINDISRSGASIIAPDNIQNITHNFQADIDGELNDVEILSCEMTEDGNVCKTKFKSPIILYKLTKEYIKRLNHFVRLAYKSPDKWDDYYDENNK